MTRPQHRPYTLRSVPAPRPIILAVRDTRSGESARYAFLRSPVRVGRRDGLELVLREPFVSSLHGLFQFDDTEVRFTDIGSRNGTLLDGARLVRDEPVLLRQGCTLVIGSLQLELSYGEPPDVSRPGASPGALTALLERLAEVPELDAADAAAHRLHSGLTIGRYELLKELGRGGFGVVFEARDAVLNRNVAWKAMLPGAAVARRHEGLLLREAEAAAQLNHPNIVTLFDVGQWEGGPFLVMELLRGESLDARLLRGALGVREALAIAVDVGRALAHAHRAGVVHRDLKPSNVFLAADGYAKVLDFGLAHVFGSGQALMGGTPRYMPPEQRRGEPPDPRSDLYSAALVLCESLGAALPATSATVPPGLPERLREVVVRSLGEDPASRPAKAGTWLEALLAGQRALDAEGLGEDPERQ